MRLYYSERMVLRDEGGGCDTFKENLVSVQIGQGQSKFFGPKLKLKVTLTRRCRRLPKFLSKTFTFMPCFLSLQTLMLDKNPAQAASLAALQDQL